METTQRVFEFYARLCPQARIEIHVASASYMHDGRTIREGEFSARVVVVDPTDIGKVVCVLASRDGHSPEGALRALFDDISGPITRALQGLGTVCTTYRDFVVVVLPKDGTREYSDMAPYIDNVRHEIQAHQALMKQYEKQT